MTCRAKMEFDGYINYRVRLKADRAADVKDIRLEIPFRRDAAAYMMGSGRKGGYRPKQWKWAWDVSRANNMVWLGDFNAGLQCKLKGPEGHLGHRRPGRAASPSPGATTARAAPRSARKARRVMRPRLQRPAQPQGRRGD